MIRLRRSVLYVPGTNARAIEKARSLDCDAVILDLEDSVPPSEKADARARVAATLQAGGFGDRELVVRLNHPSTEWGRADLLALAPLGPHALLLPKVEAIADILTTASELSHVGAAAATRLWAMIETPDAIANVAVLAGAADRNARLDMLIIGTNDLIRETRIRPGPRREPMLSWLSACVLAARRHGLDILDGVYNRLDDAAGFAAECVQGRDFGFDGKTVIHPAQIAPCNDAYSPSPDEIAWAQAVVQAFEDPAHATVGAIRVQGQMVERLHAAMAIRTMAIAKAIADRTPAA